MKLQLFSSVGLVSLVVIATLPLSTCAQQEDNCLNSLTYTKFYAYRHRTCRNIRNNAERQQAMCLLDGVAENCPQTCGRCCIDDPNHTFKLFNSREMVDCSWLTNNEARKDEYCLEWRSGRTVRDACSFSCDYCQPAVLIQNPTLPPIPGTRTPTRSPTKQPTRNPTQAPVKVPTSVPTKSPTTEPTMSSNKPTIVCANNEDYFVQGHTSQTCAWIGEYETRRRDACKNAETVRNCPQICGVCCEDDSSYKIRTNWSSNPKGCGWIKAQTNRQSRYCESVNQGRLVKLACPESCKFCFPPID